MKTVLTQAARRVVLSLALAAASTAFAQTSAPVRVPRTQDLMGPIQARVSDPNRPFDIFIEMPVYLPMLARTPEFKVTMTRELPAAR